jgi:glutamate-ammonia-ligase adenylyltransferase
VRRALETRLAAAVEGTPLAERLPAALAPLLAARGADEAFARMPDAVVRGVARAVAARPPVAVFLSHRSDLLRRLTHAGPGTLAARERELAAPAADDGADLEDALDVLRLLRREDTCLAACLQLGGLADFSEVSRFLSLLAEAIVARALGLARRVPGSGPSALDFAVVGMGKIAGREFTYHSDLDLVFLYRGDPEAVDRASRVGQRLISFLSTMTGAGVAYAVDTRLRPSGQQGMLVTSLTAFERYQCEQAHTWEHVAMLRARALAGEVEAAAATLARVRARVLRDHPSPWRDLVEMRARVERERGAAGGTRIAFKTGAGGLMDVDFLASGGLLERQLEAPPSLPSVPALLRAAAHGPGVEALLADYELLRRVEAAARWIAGRPVEDFDREGPALAALAELVQPGRPPEELVAEVEAARARIRAAYGRVVEAGSISALDRGL